MPYYPASKFNGMSNFRYTTLLPEGEAIQDAPLAGICLFDDQVRNRLARPFRPIHEKVHEIRAVHIPDGLLSNEFVVHDENKIFLDSSIYSHRSANAEKIFRAFQLQLAGLSGEIDERYSRESALVFHNEGGGTWGHFVVQLIPRAIAYLKRFPDGKLAVPMPYAHDSNSFGRALRAFGIENEALVPVERGRSYRFRELIIADIPYNFESHVPHPEAMRALYDVNVTPNCELSDRPIFVSRIGVSRSIANRADLENLLTRYGIDVVELGKKSFDQQVSQWRSSRLIIATLGSDLTNIVFARPGSSIVVLSPQWFGDTFFYNLAMLRGLRWNELSCGGEGQRPEPEKPSSFHVDLDQLETMIRSLRF